jgi:chromosome segregation protein
LAHVGVVKDDDDRRSAGQCGLPPGVILVTRAGGMWRWDGLVRRPGAVSAAAARLEQRNRLEQVEREFAEADQAAKAASETSGRGRKQAVHRFGGGETAARRRDVRDGSAWSGRAATLPSAGERRNPAP